MKEDKKNKILESITFDELLDAEYGPIGTPERDEFEKGCKEYIEFCKFLKKADVADLWDKHREYRKLAQDCIKDRDSFKFSTYLDRCQDIRIEIAKRADKEAEDLQNNILTWKTNYYVSPSMDITLRRLIVEGLIARTEELRNGVPTEALAIERIKSGAEAYLAIENKLDKKARKIWIEKYPEIQEIIKWLEKNRKKNER